MRYVSLREANQNFAKVVAEVEAGEDIVLTRRGRPVAHLTRVEQGKRKLSPEQQAAYERMVAMMERGFDLSGLKVNRDELYDRC